MRKLGLLVLSFISIISVTRAQVKADSAKTAKADTTTTARTPGKTLDKIAAIVGNSPILLSDIEQQYAQYLVQGMQPNPDMKCRKLLLIVLMLKTMILTPVLTAVCAK
jgi:peptidyl-prolyl cis-trans isomerase SurA